MCSTIAHDFSIYIEVKLSTELFEYPSILISRGGGGGGGSNNKKDHAAGKNLRCPLSFLFFFVLFQNTFKIDVFVSNLVKNVSSKKNKKDHDFRIF